MRAAGAKSVLHTHIQVSKPMGEWQNPPLAGQMLECLTARIVKADVVVEPVDVTSMGQLFFPPPCKASKCGRGEIDGLVVEKGKAICKDQLPVELLRYVFVLFSFMLMLYVQIIPNLDTGTSSEPAPPLATTSCSWEMASEQGRLRP